MTSNTTSTRRSKGRGSDGRGRGPSRSHLLDYVRVLRSRWLLAGAVFLAVFGLKIGDSLLADPVYEARAIVQMEQEPQGPQGAPSPFSSMGFKLVTAAEMEVLRSHRVTTAAAADPATMAVASIQELNEYRPLETVLRSLHGGWKACRLRVCAPPLGRGDGTLFLTFDSKGRSIRVATPDGRLLQEFGPEDWAFAEPYEDGRTLRPDDHGQVRRDPPNYVRDPWEAWTDQDEDGEYDPGKPLVLGGDAIRLVNMGGDPSGRTYVLVRRSLEKAARWLQENSLAREVHEYTGILAVGFRTNSPVIAAAAANGLTRAYQIYRENKQKREVENRIAWLDKEVTRIREKLSDYEKDRDDYVALEGGSVFLGEKASSLLSDQRELGLKKAELQARHRALEWRLNELLVERPAGEMLFYLSTDQLDAKSSALATELTQLEIERSVILSTEAATEALPEVQELNARIEKIEKRLADNVRLLVKRQKRLLELERESIEDQIEDVEGREVELQDEIDTLPAKEREFIRRSRPIEIHEELFNYLTKAKIESEMTLKSIVARVSVLNPAVPPSVRQSPKVTSTGIVAVVLGILAACAAVFLREYFIRTITSPQELEDGLGLTVYAAIPDFVTVKRRERVGVRRETSMVTIKAPNSVLSEPYRTLRANIRFTNPQHVPRTLAITSALDHEGKSITTLNLAVVMAQAHDRVLVVDADMRRPTTHVYLGGSREPGLVEILRGEKSWRDVVTTNDVPGLQVIHAGRVPRNPSALLDSKAFETLMEELREEFDQVLFDVPPVLAVADASVFFRKLDGVLLLTRYRRCTIETLDGALEQVERLGGNVLGIVFNGFDARASARRGSGYYGYYGHYSRHAAYRGGEDPPVAGL